jgi:hypothetical protein
MIKILFLFDIELFLLIFLISAESFGAVFNFNSFIIASQNLVFIFEAIITIEFGCHTHPKEVWMFLSITYIQKIIILSSQILKRIKIIQTHSKRWMIPSKSILLRRSMTGKLMTRFY